MPAEREIERCPPHDFQEETLTDAMYGRCGKCGMRGIEALLELMGRWCDACQDYVFHGRRSCPNTVARAAREAKETERE